MAAPKSFKAARQAQRIEPFTVTWTDEAGDEHDSEFKAYLPIPGALILDATNIVVDQNSVALRSVFQAAMRDGYEEFWAFLSDPGRSIDAELLGDIVAWLYEESSGRPTEPSAL